MRLVWPPITYMLCLLQVLNQGCQTSTLKVVQTSQSFYDEDAFARFEADLPGFEGASAKQWNDTISALYNREIDSFRTFIADFEPVGDRVMSTDHIVGKQKGGLVSILLHHTWAVPGASVLIHRYQPLIIDYGKGRILWPASIFSDPDSLYKTINRVVSHDHPSCGMVSRDQLRQFVINPDGSFSWHLWLYTGDPSCLEPVVIELSSERVAPMK